MATHITGFRPGRLFDCACSEIGQRKGQVALSRAIFLSLQNLEDGCHDGAAHNWVSALRGIINEVLVACELIRAPLYRGKFIIIITIIIIFIIIIIIIFIFPSFSFTFNCRTDFVRASQCHLPVAPKF